MSKKSTSFLEHLKNNNKIKGDADFAETNLLKSENWGNLNPEYKNYTYFFANALVNNSDFKHIDVKNENEIDKLNALTSLGKLTKQYNIKKDELGWKKRNAKAFEKLSTDLYSTNLTTKLLTGDELLEGLANGVELLKNRPKELEQHVGHTGLYYPEGKYMFLNSKPSGQTKNPVKTFVHESTHALDFLGNSTNKNQPRSVGIIQKFLSGVSKDGKPITTTKDLPQGDAKLLLGELSEIIKDPTLKERIGENYFPEIIAHTMPQLLDKWNVNENTNPNARKLLKRIMKDTRENYKQFGIKEHKNKDINAAFKDRIRDLKGTDSDSEVFSDDESPVVRTPPMQYQFDISHTPALNSSPPFNVEDMLGKRKISDQEISEDLSAPTKYIKNTKFREDEELIDKLREMNIKELIEQENLLPRGFFGKPVIGHGSFKKKP